VKVSVRVDVHPRKTFGGHTSRVGGGFSSTPAGYTVRVIQK